MLDSERCILCSRCVRFSDEITKTSELGIVNRGDHSEITVHPDQELNNPYSGNVVDLCPVGALTDKDFRFKCRVWYLKSADSICPGCARGCNIQIHYNTDRPQHGSGERVMRLKPRENPEVNQWWICDAGRYGYKSIDHNRIERPMVRKGKGKVSLTDEGRGDFTPTEVSWDFILDEVAQKIREAKGKIGVFVSQQLSNEELSLTKKLFSGDRFQTFLFSPNPEGDQDDFLIRSDKNPNTKGAELMGFKSTGVEEFFKECEEGKIEGLLIFGQDLLSLLDPRRVEPALNDLQWTVFIGPNHNLMSEAASYVLPSAVYAEKNGTFTNFQGKVQKFNKAFEPLGESRPECEILQEIANRLGVKLSLAAAG